MNELNKRSELRSQRKQIVITQSLDKNLKTLAQIKGTSFNELANIALSDYVEEEFKNDEIKNIANSLKKIQEDE